MRKLIVLPLLVAGTFAGTAPHSSKAPIVSAKSAKTPIVPPTPDLYQWFAGGTAGYLLDKETEFFSGHIGTDLPYTLGCWETAVYLEVGYFECDHDFTRKRDIKFDDKKYYGDPKYDPSYGTSIDFEERLTYELEFIPVTLNYKLERELTPSLNAYLGVGAGVAFIDLSNGLGQSDSDTVFFAQAFAGLLYELNESVELYAGARVIYFDDPSFNLGGTEIDLDSLEAEGFKVDNVDALVEGGVRFNF